MPLDFSATMASMPIPLGPSPAQCLNRGLWPEAHIEKRRLGSAVEGQSYELPREDPGMDILDPHDVCQLDTSGGFLEHET